MIKIRMFLTVEGGIKKLPSFRLSHVPRKGERILWDKKDYEVVEVSWDLEEREPEVALELKLIELGV